MKTVIVALMLILAWPAQAAVGCYGSDSEDCRWTVVDTSVQLTVNGLQLVDWMQTRWMLDHHYLESNPLLGSSPSRGKLALAVGSSMILHAAVARLLPKPWRTLWQSITIAFEVPVIGMNADLVGGIRLELP